MYLARELTPLSLTEIARGFDRDHTTVLHAIRTVSSRLEPGSETAETIHRVRSALGREPTRRRHRTHGSDARRPQPSRQLIHSPPPHGEAKFRHDPQPSTNQIHLMKVGR